MRLHSEFVGECSCGKEVKTDTHRIMCMNKDCPECYNGRPVEWPADYQPEPEIKVVEE